MLALQMTSGPYFGASQGFETLTSQIETIISSSVPMPVVGIGNLQNLPQTHMQNLINEQKS
jgi:hypothetical protein